MKLGFIDDLEPKKQAIHAEWESARDREKASRSRFAQHTLSPEAARTMGRVTVQPVLPVDILGAYALLPMPENGGAP